MIKTENGGTKIAGDLAEIAADTALILMNIYARLKDELGEAGAKEMIVEIGRAAMEDKRIAEFEKERCCWKYDENGNELFSYVEPERRF